MRDFLGRDIFSMQIGCATHLLVIFLLTACTAPPPPPEPRLTSDASIHKLPGYVVKREKRARNALVLVHGITGDGTSSWTSRNGSYWPKLMEGDPAFENFDIYVHEYPTSLFGGCLAVSDLATDMHAHLKSDSVIETHEKVLFLAHSMGGLVVRTFLLRYRETADKIPMLIFFGTPSAGSRKADLSALLPTCSQVEDLRTLDANSFLKNQQSDWLSSGLQDRIVSYCAVETQTTAGSLTVERGSATLLCTRAPQAVPTDHSEIVKPNNTSDLPHIFVKNALSDLATLQKRMPTNVTSSDEHINRESSRKAETARRKQLLQTLSREYILSHDNISPGLLAGTEWPPLDWMNQRLRDLGESWSVMPGKNAMQLIFEEKP